MTHGSGTRYRAVPMRSELCVVVGCHTFVSAIPTRFVSRLVLNEDVEVAKQKELVYSSGETFVNANLGTLLGLPPLGEACVLLQVPHAGTRVPIALRTGPCLAVRDVCVEAPLPAGLFQSRGEAVLGAFEARRATGFESAALYGLMLDVTKLWTPAELDAALQISSPRKRRSDG